MTQYLQKKKRTIFSLFSTYEDANAAIQYMIDNRFTINEMNAIIQRDIKENMFPATIDSKKYDFDSYGLTRIK